MFLHTFLSGVDKFFNLFLSVATSIFRHPSLMFRSYSDNLSAILNQFWFSYLNEQKLESWDKRAGFCSYRCLMAASAIPDGYYSAPNFFSTRRGVLEQSFFKINFIGVIFEAGNETREKFWSVFGAEQKWRVERRESGFCS